MKTEKMHATILTYSIGDFQKSRKMCLFVVFFQIFLKMLKHLLYIKFQMFGIFKSPEPGCKHLQFNFIKKKMHTKICLYQKR